MKALIISALMISACIPQQETLTWEYLLQHQVSDYSNEDGVTAHHVWCHEPGVCLHLAGLVCPQGYNKSGEMNEDHQGWSTSSRANQYFAASRGGSYEIKETQFNFVCKPAHSPSVDEQPMKDDTSDPFTRTP